MIRQRQELQGHGGTAQKVVSQGSKSYKPITIPPFERSPRQSEKIHMGNGRFVSRNWLDGLVASWLKASLCLSIRECGG